MPFPITSNKINDLEVILTKTCYFKGAFVKPKKEANKRFFIRIRPVKRSAQLLPR